MIAGMLQLKEAPSFTLQKGQKRNFAATFVKSNSGLDEKLDPIPHEEAFIASVSLAPGLDREAWLDGKAMPAQQTQEAGVVTLMDLRQANQVRFRSSFNLVLFYFTKNALNGISEDQGGGRIDALTAKLGLSIPDPTLHRLASALLPAFERPNETSQVFVNHLMLAAGAHILKEYAGIDAAEKVHRGGLAPWQQKRAIEIIVENLDGGISLPEIAQQCGLSTRHFTRAFAQSMGMPPHQWLLQQRVEKSKQMMHQSSLPLTEIAVSSGFADQSHFTRAFSQSQGISPGAWRRLHATA